MNTVTCINGPYAGQTFKFSLPSIAWYEPTHTGPKGNRVIWEHTGPLMWINHGTDKHCYQLMLTYNLSAFLIYRDTF